MSDYDQHATQSGPATAARNQATPSGQHSADSATGQSSELLGGIVDGVLAIGQSIWDWATGANDLPTGPPAADLLDMTLNDFAMFADSQLDWANNSNLDDNARTVLWAWLDFAHQSDSVLAGCGGMRVSALEAAGRTPDVLGPLRTYSDAIAQAANTVELTNTTDAPTEGVTWGEALATLEQGVGGPVLKVIMRQEDFDALLAEPDGVRVFVDYVTVVHPLLHAAEGAEITSFIAMKQAATNYASYNTLLPDVRSFHRFEEPALSQLATNVGDTSKSKPLTLILHSAMDHNGAFHRDPNLTAAVTDPRNLTLMIEGATSLSAVTGQIQPLAKRYGQRDKLDQVMIAGHGNAQVIELAGDTAVANGEQTESQQAVQVGDPLSEALMDELIRNMDPTTPNHRVVFNACLTASNSVPPGVVTGATPRAQARQIVDHISHHPSLATAFGQRAQASAGKGKQAIDSLGANASIGQVGLIDPATGALDIRSAEDPSVTAPKVDYIKTGIEPGGAMRAVLEVWGQNRSDALDAVRFRQANPVSGWAEPIIQVHYGLVERKYPSSGGGIAALVEGASWIYEGQFESTCRVANMAPPTVPAADLPHIFQHLMAHSNFSGIPHLPLVLQQVWLAQDASHQAAFLERITSGGFSCQTVAQFIDFGWLSSHMAALMTVGVSAANEVGRKVLALLSVADGQGDAACVDYVKRMCQANGDRLPADATQLLSGRAGEQEMLVAVGLRQPAGAAAPTTTAAAPANNVDTNRDGAKDQHFHPNRRTETTVRAGDVYQAPDSGSRVLDGIAAGTAVQIEGEQGKWYAVRHGQLLGYVTQDRF